MEGQRHSARQAAWFLCLVVGLSLPAFGRDQEPADTHDSQAAASDEKAQAEEKKADPDDEELAGDARPLSVPVVPESPLVKAAQSNRAKQKPRIVITDEDVRNSKGKLIEVGGTLSTSSAARKEEPSSTSSSSSPAPPPLTPEKKAELRKHYEDLISTKTKAIEDLEKEIEGLEEDFYVEQDPAMRDRIDQRFVEAQRELDAARESLEETRKVYDEFRRRDN